MVKKVDVLFLFFYRIKGVMRENRNIFPLSFLKEAVMGKKSYGECAECDRELTRWDIQVSKTLAYKYPVCKYCMADEYDMKVEALEERMEHFYGIRPCQV